MEIVASIFLKLVSIIMLILSVLSSILLILTFRKPRKVSVPAIFITAAIGLITLTVLSAVAGYAPEVWVWIIMVLAGAGAGVLQARTTRLYREEDRIMSRNSIWYIVAWAALLALNQLIIIVSNNTPAITMALLIMGTAVIWGTSGDILRCYYSMKPSMAAPIAVSPVPETPPVQTVVSVQEPLQPPAAFETAPDRPAETASTPTIVPTGFCKNCGHKLAQGDFFCHSCGEKI